MAETVVVTTQERTEHGTHAARRLRKTGLIPAVVYGHMEATVPISISGEEIERAIRHGSHVIDLKHGDKTETTIIREVQWDPLGHEVLHVDFARVGADERVLVPVPVIVRGIAPGIAAGGVLVQPIHSLSLECLVTSIPESIRVSVAELQLEQAIHVRDLKIPDGVVVKDDPDAIVVQIVPKTVEEEVPGVVAEQAEPEIIGRKEKEEAEAE